MEMIDGMRSQLLAQLKASGFVGGKGGTAELNRNAASWAAIEAALCAGDYPNLLRVDRRKLTLATAKESKVRFHPSSALAPIPDGPLEQSTHLRSVQRLPVDWLVFEEMTRMHRLAYVQCCTAVSPLAVTIFAGPARLPGYVIAKADEVEEFDDAELTIASGGDDIHDVDAGNDDANDVDANDDENEFANMEPEEDVEFAYDGEYEEEEGGEEEEEEEYDDLTLEDWLQFETTKEISKLVMQLRIKWQSMLMRKLRTSFRSTPQDEEIINTVISVLCLEEQSLGMQSPMDLVSDGRNRSRTAHPYANRNLPFATYQQRVFTNQHLSSRSNSSPLSNIIGDKRSNVVNNKYDVSKMTSSTSGADVTKKTSVKGAEVATVLFPSDNPNRYFVMKCQNKAKLNASKTRGFWETSSRPIGSKLQMAFKEGKTIYLLFSITGSGCFNGYGTMSSNVKEYGQGASFKVVWIKRDEVSFSKCQGFHNSWNNNTKVQMSSDGQEIEPSVGEQLLQLWGGPTQLAPGPAHLAPVSVPLRSTSSTSAALPSPLMVPISISLDEVSCSAMSAKRGKRNGGGNEGEKSWARGGRGRSSNTNDWSGHMGSNERGLGFGRGFQQPLIYGQRHFTNSQYGRRGYFGGSERGRYYGSEGYYHDSQSFGSDYLPRRMGQRGREFMND